MQKTFEKIRERLKNELYLAQEDCERYLNGNTNQFLYARARGYEVAMENAIEIVDQVAEEYQECALCYFGSPCEYQNKDARMPESELNNGWIPCSERLPKVYIPVLVTYRRNDGTRKVVVAKMEADCEWKIEFGGYCDSESVIAWQPLHEPYKENENDR